MSFIANARVIVPGAGVSEGYIGHYDLQLNGTVNIKGRAFINPVFSFRQNSELHIFNVSESTKAYKKNYEHCTIYKWPFTIANDAKLNEFCNQIVSITDSASYKDHDKCEGGFICNVKEGNVFHKYVLEETNCFRAVATWLNALGNYTLKLIYDGTHDNAYMKYSAQKTVDKYFDNCEFFNP